MRTLLVAPRYVRQTGDYYEFPLGLCYVSASLKAKGFAVSCLNLNHTDESLETAVRRAVIQQDIDVVCTGGLSVHYNSIKAVLEAAKQARRDVVTVAGGGAVSSAPDLLVRSTPMDIGVVGEGEETMVHILRTLEESGDLSQAPGVHYRTPDQKVAATPPRQAIADLDSLPFPDYEGFDVETYLDLQRPFDNYYLYPFDRPRLLPIISSRSCPFNCTFCYHPLGKKYRKRSLDNFFAELDGYVRRYGVNMVAILDELFSVDRKRLKEFVSRMEGYGLKWIAQLRVDSVDAEDLGQLKRAGLFYISYGLENAADSILRSMKKHITVSQIESTLAATREAEIGIQGNFLFGDPAETMETARTTLDWWRSHAHYHINLSRVAPYPGSEIYGHCRDKGIIADELSYLQQGCPVVNMTTLTQEQLDAIEEEMGRCIVEHRTPAAILGSREEGCDPVKGRRLYTLDLRCPHCGKEISYRHFAIGAIETVKLGCRHCNQRFDIQPRAFGHIARLLDETAARLTRLAAGGRPLSISPCLPEPVFREYMDILGVPPESLNLQYVFDNRPHLWGRKYLGRLPVGPRSREILAEKCAGHLFFVVSCFAYESVVRSYRNECGIPEEDLVYVPFDRDQQAAPDRN